MLGAFADRLAKDSSAQCHFVSQDNASDLHKLTGKARLANDFDEFRAILAEDQRDAFKRLCSSWRTDEPVAFEWLKRTCVGALSGSQLDWTMESLGDLLFSGGGPKAFPILRDIAEEHFNKRLTMSSLRAAIEARGDALSIKEPTTAATIDERIAVETTSYLDTYTPFGVGGETIRRQEVERLVQEIVAPDGAELILLTGVAGSGKSGIVRAVIAQLAANNIAHLAFRVDHCLHCSSREELGRHLLGRSEGPVTSLKAAHPRERSVLIIDQVDAVSEVSGRDGAVRKVIFQLIADAHNFGDMKVVVVCRTFDLESDPRLKQLKQLERTSQIETPLLDWAKNVEPVLTKLGFPTSQLGEPQRRLLALPVNLAIFLEIGENDLAFQSRSGLHEKLLEKKQRQISKAMKPGWTVIQPLASMCDWMSARQVLHAPVSVLDPYPDAADILGSEGLIVVSRGSVNFFHESFFDHVFARSFLSRGQTLREMLLSTQQHLFRRTQVRQILEALRQHDFPRYLEELSSILFDQSVRFHIKFAVCQWLASVEEPTEAEFAAINKLDDLDDHFNQLFRRAALSSHTWFGRLQASDWLRVQLGGNEKRVDTILWWLASIAGERPGEISALLREWWKGNQAKAEQLIGWFGFIRLKRTSGDLLDLCCDVIAAHPGVLFRDDGRDRIMMMLHTWENDAPEQCGRLLEAIFDAWRAEHPGGNPFDRDEEKVITGHSLNELLKKAPKALVSGLTRALADAVDNVVSEGQDGQNWYFFSHRSHSGHRSGFNEFLGIYVDALKRVAATDVAAADQALAQLDPQKHEALMHVHLETLQANPREMAFRLPALAASPLVFDAGWQGADWMSLATACRAAFPHLAVGQRRAIEDRILNYNEELDWASRLLRKIADGGEEAPYRTRGGAIRALNRSGHSQWCILETIGQDSLGPAASQRLHQLRRKFRARKVDEPVEIEAHFVGSPIKRERCGRMSDWHWLSAITRYDNDEERTRGRGFINGGARQLAGELQEAAKKDPCRFSALLPRIPLGAHKSYVEHLLGGLAEAEDAPEEALADAVLYAHGLPGRPHGNEIARIFHNHPHLAANPSAAEALIWYALQGEAREDEALDAKSVERETLTIDNLIRRGGGLHIRGINGARGWAWEALGAVLWQVPTLSDAVWPALETATEQEPLVGVRCCMMRPLVPLFNDDKVRFEAVLRKLVGLSGGTPIDKHPNRLAPLITHTGVHVMPYILGWMPQFGQELIEQLLSSGDQTKELIASWFVFGESFRSEEYVRCAEELSARSVDHRRLLADVAGDVLTWAENSHRADALLRRFFFDDDNEVRRQAADAFRHVKSSEVERFRDLTREFLHSPAFADEHGSFAVLHMLEKAACDVLDVVIEAAERTIANLSANGDRNGRRGTDVHRIQDMLKREYVSSERNPQARGRILDMLDLMLAREVHGAESIVSAHDRW